MSNVQYSVTSGTYETKYKTGYGHEYPEGHVIRVHRHVLEYELGMTGGSVIDYGCGTGTYLYYFGCDISATAIERCRTRMPAHAANFHVIPSVPKLRDYFSRQFDLVFSNQTLYHLNDRDLHDVLSQLYGILRPGGAIYASMISCGSYYAKCVEGSVGGLRGRLNQTTYVNFKTRDQVLELFTSHGFTRAQLVTTGH